MKSKRIEILQKVASGELTPEQADTQLLNLPVISKTFMPGVQVKITDCLIGHEFEIGEVVTLEERVGEKWLARDSRGEKWFITEDEAEIYYK